MAVYWTERCGCEIWEYGYGRRPELRHCDLHSAPTKLRFLCQEMIEAHDNGLEPLEAALDRIIPEMRVLAAPLRRI
jgi:hypothetical protein